MENIREIVSIIDTNSIKMVAVSNDKHTKFAGVVENGTISIISTESNRLNELLIRAVNNRTRERNYFKMYSELLEGELTDEDFDNEIEQNKDEYVVPAGKDADIRDVELAMQVVKYLKGVQSTDDFTALFSFSDKSIQNSIVEKENNGRICKYK